MKKKVILIVSLISLMACIFALSVSASNYIDLSNVDLSYDGVEHVKSFSAWTNELKVEDSWQSTAGEEIGVITSEELNVYGWINIEWWHSFFQAQNVKSLDDYYTAIKKAVELGYIEDTLVYLTYALTAYAEQLYNAYLSYVDSLNGPGYQTGYTEGYTDGYDVGVDDYKNTDEYKNVIKAQYNKGLEAGSKEDNSSSFSLVSALSLIATLCTIGGFVLLVMKSKKTRRN